MLLAVFLASAALALEEGDVSIEKRGRAYAIHMSFYVPASVYQVRSVLEDYRHPDRLTSTVKDREIIGQQDGLIRVSTELRGCALFFCKTMKLIQDISASQDTIRADVVPDGSDFRSGYLLWSVSGNESGRSHVKFEALMEPDFFVPPLIGGLLIRRALEKQAIETARNLESEAALEATSPVER